MSKKQSNLRWILLPFSLLYGLVVGIRNRLFDWGLLKSKEFDIPVLCVGNLTVGGTGKTPHVEYLVGMLKKHFKVATLSRGYKRKSKGFRLATPESNVEEIGDEPKQIKNKFPDVDVAVDVDRIKGIEQLTSDDFHTKLDVIILDDAYQHRWVKPGLSILLIDYNRPLSEDYLLPVGSLRERSDNKSRANIIIMAKSPRNMKPIEHRIILNRLNLYPYQNLYFTAFKYLDPIPVFNNISTELKPEDLKENDFSILLLTGIAYPVPFTDYLESLSKDIHHLEFKDHHSYNSIDINLIHSKFESIQSTYKILVTTEKDAVRLQENVYISEEIKKYMFYIPIEIEFLRNEEETFNKQIINYARKNKRNYGFYKRKS